MIYTSDDYKACINELNKFLDANLNLLATTDAAAFIEDDVLPCLERAMKHRLQSEAEDRAFGDL